MSWLYERFTVPSEKNGEITCRRLFGRWRVLVGVWDETSSYMETLWGRAIKKYLNGARVKTVLMLGLGAGGTIELLHRRFPGCSVTAIEWDPEMVKLGDQLRLFCPEHRPRVLVGDAFEILPSLEEKFDLVIFDLFRGREAAPIVKRAEICRRLQTMIQPDGYLLFNAFQQPELFRDLDPFLARHATWRYKYNKVALYRPFGKGHAGDPFPTGYVQFRQADDYLKRHADVDGPRKLVGEPGCYGFRWGHGPLRFEGYVSDREPKILSGPSRLIIWQTLTRLDCPSGWHRSPVQMNQRQTGFSEIKHPEKYWEAWTPHAQRHRKRWLKERPFTVEEVEFEPFLAAYLRHKKLRWLKGSFVDLLKKKVRVHGSFVHFLVARDPITRDIQSGFAYLDLPETKQSIHLISFIMPSAMGTSVGTGLMDEWFIREIAAGNRFLDFDIFWAPGEPREWKGFSRFKSQFVTHFIRYPNPLLKWVKSS